MPLTIEETRQAYIDIMERLASDDKFRNLMEKDPIEASRLYGIECNERDNEKPIPSKQEILDRMEEYKTKINEHSTRVESYANSALKFF